MYIRPTSSDSMTCLSVAIGPGSPCMNPSPTRAVDQLTPTTAIELESINGHGTVNEHRSTGIRLVISAPAVRSRRPVVLASPYVDSPAGIRLRDRGRIPQHRPVESANPTEQHAYEIERAACPIRSLTAPSCGRPAAVMWTLAYAEPSTCLPDAGWCFV